MNSNTSRYLRIVAAGLFIGLTVLASESSARVVGAETVSMQVLVNGVPLAEYAARGTRYVEASEGLEYSLRLSNRTNDRVAVAVSVDGLNTIDAKTTTAGNASKWILGPWETIVLDGWQTSSDTARRFFFTTEKKSYGAWLGKTSNLGVISAAVFRERVVRRAPVHQPRLKKEASEGRGAGMDEESVPGSRSGRDVPQEAPSAPEREETQFDEPLSDTLAATGIGRELDHRVRSVRFLAEPTPAQVVEIRYEYRDALVSLGVLPRCGGLCDEPLARRERARGFSDTGFAPDPFR